MPKHKIPNCPNCGKKLNKVFENEYLTYAFNPETGKYKSEEEKGYLEMTCPYCEVKLFDIFPNGVCNYKTN
ncbi:hypothetical protein KY314_01695 [Candidatus Woesearchaeota archaeon]|nr:hypothetical protein [Candidatus Woesearchaeota archaeon]